MYKPGFWILSIVGASTLFLNRRITSWFQYIGTALCLVTKIFAYAKIFFSLRHNQIHVQNHVAQGQPSQAISLNVARYRKAVYSALWTQGTLVICHLPFFMVDVFTPQRGMPLSIYLAKNFTLNYHGFPKLVIKPVAVLLEDQRTKASCKRNIKATLLSF